MKKSIGDLARRHTATCDPLLLHQVVLLTSSTDPVAQSLTDMLAKRTGCQVIQVGEEPLDDLKPEVEKRKLQWKDVAYMGKQLYCTFNV